MWFAPYLEDVDPFDLSNKLFFGILILKACSKNLCFGNKMFQKMSLNLQLTRTLFYPPIIISIHLFGQFVFVEEEIIIQIVIYLNGKKHGQGFVW